MSQAQAAPPAQRSGLFGRLWSGKVRGRGCLCGPLHALLSHAGITQRCAPPHSPDRARRAPARPCPARARLPRNGRAVSLRAQQSVPAAAPKPARVRGAGRGRGPQEAREGQAGREEHDVLRRGGAPRAGRPLCLSRASAGRRRRVSLAGRGAGTAACPDRLAARLSRGKGAGAWSHG
jgi:hypothetical protein